MLDLETLKGEIEFDNDNNNEEYDKICKELASVNNSLKHIRLPNSKLTAEITDNTTEI